MFVESLVELVGSLFKREAMRFASSQSSNVTCVVLTLFKKGATEAVF